MFITTSQTMVRTALKSALALLIGLGASSAHAASADEIKRGEYLARAGDCIACHTDPTGHRFSGGRAMPTPFGTIYTPNITPDRETGIGNWTAEEFYNMMRTGRSRDGTYLYPAMPFPAYTKVTRADSDAIFAFLKSVPAVRQPNRPHDLRFPYNNRNLLIGWRTLFFREGEYQPDPKQSAEWNRGAYLVQGLGHCASCHTAINALGGSSTSKPFEGGLIPMQDWYAPSLTSNREAGLGEWSLKDIADLLQTGVSQRGAVYGPMSEVVHNSLQYMSDADTRAMSVYLKSLPDRSGGSATPASAPRPTLNATEQRRYNEGQKIYAAQCAVCHASDGRGMPPHFPPLANNQSIQMQSAVNPIRMVLNGGYPPATAKNPMPYGMPPFAQMLNDEQVAAVVTYVRLAWGNVGTPVTPAQANTLRKAPLN
ncbi:c-type cytochrome [Chitinasiproducens palmae]|uniref:Cytochrome c, mono-and diheme variants n=1 Tax=Chitinasiproducens palmae TaxID=1770053 RepID=A0A1H2PTS6_9BURK|nr:cytochrome c [Chitinasiproducens palmae]SDV50523.1 Cytochrome c, mono-and diheme variants [Chitinasiproducens palmae]